MSTIKTNERVLVDFQTQTENLTLKGQSEMADGKVITLSGEFFTSGTDAPALGGFHLLINPYNPTSTDVKAEVAEGIVQAVSELGVES